MWGGGNGPASFLPLFPQEEEESTLPPNAVVVPPLGTEYILCAQEMEFLPSHSEKKV